MDVFITITSYAATPASKIENLTIDGAGLAVRGVKMTGNSQLHGVRVQNCAIAGAFMETANSTVIDKCAFVANGVGLCATNGADASTRWSVKSSIFRQNTSHGFLIQEGINCDVKDCVFESNTGNGMQIFKTGTDPVTGIRVSSCYWENNGASSVTDDRYQLLIDDTLDTPSSGPTYLKFENCFLNAFNATQRDLRIHACIWTEFVMCNFSATGGAIAADAIQLAANATAVTFVDKEGAVTPLASYGNRGFEIQKDRSGDGGLDYLDSNGTVHLRAARLHATNFVSAPYLTNVLFSSGSVRLNDGDITLTPPAGNHVRIPLSSTGTLTVDTGGFVTGPNTGTIFNDAGNDVDFRIESDQNANMFNIDGELTGRLSIGETVSTTAYVKIGGTWIPSFAGGVQQGLDLTTSVTGAAGANIYVAHIGGTLVEAGSGNHPVLTGTNFDPPTITTGDATATSASTVTISGPTTATVSGANYSLLVSSGTIGSGGNIVTTAAGSGIQIKEGSNARMGTSVLVNGTVTVSNTSVTANTRVFLTRQVQAGTTSGSPSLGTVVAATSFVINSLTDAAAVSADDDSTIAWILVEPSP